MTRTGESASLPEHQAPVDDGEKLATIARGPGHELRLRLREFKGHQFVDIREWAKSERDETWWPVKGKGVTIKPRELADVVNALEAARRLS